jgi:hypothetical protein
MQPIPTSHALVPLNKGGRPSGFNWQIAHDICDHIACGNSLRSFCNREDAPSQSMVFRWLRENEKFREYYVRAREDQADTFIDEIKDISDDGSNDWMERRYGDEMVWVVNGEAMGRSRLRIETRKWIAGKMKARTYGDKLETTHKLDATDAFIRMLQAVSPGGAKLRVVGGRAA